MNHDEILQAAKEAGCNDEFIKMAPCWLERFAAIIKRKTIEQCANKVKDMKSLGIDYFMADIFAAAIRKLGEE